MRILLIALLLLAGKANAHRGVNCIQTCNPNGTICTVQCY